MTKTNAKAVKMIYNDVTVTPSSYDLLSFTYVENGVENFITYFSDDILDADYNEYTQQLTLILKEDYEVVEKITNNEVEEGTFLKGDYFVLNPIDSDAKFYGVLSEDYNNEDTIKCLFNIFVDGDTIYDVSLNEEIEFQIGDVITKPTDDELEFITSTLKKQGYFYNESSYKIERLN